MLSLVLATLVAAPQTPPEPARSPHPKLDGAEKFIRERASGAEIRKHLRRLSEDPHVAGSQADYESALYVKSTLESFGFETEIETYHAYLPYPEEIGLRITAPNEIELDLREHPNPRDKDSYDDVIATYNAYSASGVVEAPVVYAFKGRAEDFDWLEEKGVNVRGKICLIRYGGVFRGLKVREAAEHGAAGVLLYSDPDDDGYRKGDVHPDGPWRPEHAVQRGSILYLSEMCGDPLTPGWASTKEAERLAPAECSWLPTIPCIPISSANAGKILAAMKGPNVSGAWQGGCPVTYHTGPGPVRVEMTVRCDNEIRPLWNVLGRLRAPSTSKRYVLIGGHRDAWVHGANDPTSGQALALEAMRILGRLVADGWEPHYEIRFASWDAEEFGLVGSTEWCEDHADAIQRECLAYFNCDGAVSGTRFGASSTPDLVRFLGEVAARTTPHDNQGRLLTRWAHGGSRPPVGELGSGSDYTAFVCRLGIPALDFGSRGGHGVYHSLHDTLFTMETYLDPGFAIHESMARFLATAAYRFAKSSRPPLDESAWAPWLESAIAKLNSLDDDLREKLLGQVAALREACKDEADEEQLIGLHRALLDEQGIQSRPWFRNLLVAPGIDLGYGAATLPDLDEALESGDEARIEAAAKKLSGVLDAMAFVLRSE